jgi:hypothetical protein
MQYNLFQFIRQILAFYSPVCHANINLIFTFDSHVLSIHLAFIRSQDQTLKLFLNSNYFTINLFYILNTFSLYKPVKLFILYYFYHHKDTSFYFTKELNFY